MILHLDYTASNGRINKRRVAKGFEGSGNNICQEELRKTIQTPLKIAGVPAKI
jgi:hypothetical protein